MLIYFINKTLFQTRITYFQMLIIFLRLVLGFFFIVLSIQVAISKFSIFFLYMFSLVDEIEKVGSTYKIKKIVVYVIEIMCVLGYSIVWFIINKFQSRISFKIQNMFYFIKSDYIRFVYQLILYRIEKDNLFLSDNSQRILLIQFDSFSNNFSIETFQSFIICVEVTQSQAPSLNKY
ncbi:hypothetical protein ABPG74_019010 [Tetrahymena malaccensis]